MAVEKRRCSHPLGHRVTYGVAALGRHSGHRWRSLRHSQPVGGDAAREPCRSRFGVPQPQGRLERIRSGAQGHGRPQEIRRGAVPIVAERPAGRAADQSARRRSTRRSTQSHPGRAVRERVRNRPRSHADIRSDDPAHDDVHRLVVQSDIHRGVPTADDSGDAGAHRGHHQQHHRHVRAPGTGSRAVCRCVHAHHPGGCVFPAGARRFGRQGGDLVRQLHHPSAELGPASGVHPEGHRRRQGARQLVAAGRPGHLRDIRQQVAARVHRNPERDEEHSPRPRRRVPRHRPHPQHGSAVVRLHCHQNWWLEQPDEYVPQPLDHLQGTSAGEAGARARHRVWSRESRGRRRCRCAGCRGYCGRSAGGCRCAGCRGYWNGTGCTAWCRRLCRRRHLRSPGDHRRSGLAGKLLGQQDYRRGR